jgi:hypothetical protein
MAWPYDARSTSYSAGLPVLSADLNEIQDLLNEIIGGVGGTFQIPLSNGISAVDGAWIYNALISVQDGWQRAAASDLWIPIPAREGARLTQVEIKYEDSGSSGSWSFDLQEVDANWDSGTTAPTTASLDNNAPAASAGWHVQTLSSGSLPRVLPADSLWILQCNAPANGDHVAGVRATFDRMFASAVS